MGTSRELYSKPDMNEQERELIKNAESGKEELRQAGGGERGYSLPSSLPRNQGHLL